MVSHGKVIGLTFLAVCLVGGLVYLFRDDSETTPDPPSQGGPSIPVLQNSPRVPPVESHASASQGQPEILESRDFARFSADELAAAASKCRLSNQKEASFFHAYAGYLSKSTDVEEVSRHLKAAKLGHFERDVFVQAVFQDSPLVDPSNVSNIKRLAECLSGEEQRQLAYAQTS